MNCFNNEPRSFISVTVARSVSGHDSAEEAWWKIGGQWVGTEGRGRGGDTPMPQKRVERVFAVVAIIILCTIHNYRHILILCSSRSA